MADRSNGARPRARSDAVRRTNFSPLPEESTRQTGPSVDGEQRNAQSPQQASFPIPEREFRSPQRAATTLSQLAGLEADLRRRSTAASRRSTVRDRAGTVAGRSRYTTLAGPEETTQLRLAHEPFVQTGYAELNPSYEQPANSKPVWSLAKPLPRVVRPGMVPTQSEILESRMNAELPGENSQKLGLEVDPNDLEKGKVQVTPNLAKLSAQLKDSRAQRENNFLNKVQQGGTSQRLSSRLSTVASRTSRVGRQSISRQRPLNTTWEEIEEEQDEKADDFKVSEEGNTTVEVGTAQEDQATRLPAARPSLDPIPEGREPMKDSDAQSLSTLNVDEDPALWQDMEAILQSHVEDEIHNNHTSWSVVRTHHREFLAELLAVFVQLTLGFTSDLAVTVARQGDPNTTDWAFAFATMIGIYISGGISGAHLNPSITTMLWFFRGFPKRKMPEYFLAQFLGAFIAALTAYGIYYASIQNYLQTNDVSGVVNSFVTNQRYTYIDAATAFFNEFLGTAILTATVLALGDDQNAPPGAGMNAVIIGFVIFVLSSSFAFQTGAALNPSRDFGPRLALLALGYGSELFTNPYWFYGPFAGTLSGAFLGASLYDIAIFTGGESPINYPWSRTRRAMHKSKKKWQKRLHVGNQEIDDDAATVVR